MKTVLKILVGILVASVVITVFFELFGVLVGASFSLLGLLMKVGAGVVKVAFSFAGAVLRLAANPVVLILLVVFLLTRRTGGATSDRSQ